MYGVCAFARSKSSKNKLGFPQRCGNKTIPSNWDDRGREFGKQIGRELMAPLRAGFARWKVRAFQKVLSAPYVFSELEGRRVPSTEWNYKVPAGTRRFRKFTNLPTDVTLDLRSAENGLRHSCCAQRCGRAFALSPTNQAIRAISIHYVGTDSRPGC